MTAWIENRGCDVAMYRAKENRRDSIVQPLTGAQNSAMAHIRTHHRVHGPILPSIREHCGS